MNKREFIWYEKYRPQKLKDCVLPKDIKKTLKAAVKNGNVQNLIFAGGPGRGKTTAAMAMLNDIGSPYFIVNGPLDVNMDLLRNDITQFASSMSVTGKRKYVIIDEADYLNSHIQPSLRNFIEQYSATCGFIFTCNYKDKLIDPIFSRLPVIDFNYPNEEKQDLAKQIIQMLVKIMEAEGVAYDIKVVAQLVLKNFPDMRRMINEIQKYAQANELTIDAGILRDISTEDINKLIELLKAKNFTEIRRWVANIDKDDITIFNTLYELAPNYMQTASIPALVLLISKYMYQSAFAANKQINLLAFLVEVMIEVQFK